MIFIIWFFLKLSMEDSMGVLYSDDGLTLIRGNSQLTTFQIPSRVVRLADGDSNYNCFGHCQITTSITFEKNSNLEYIGEYAFYSTKITSIDLQMCTKLNHIAYRSFLSSSINTIFFPDSVENIGRESFDECKLTSLKIPPKVKILYFWVFAHNKQLTTFTYDENCALTTIMSEAFMGSGLTSVTVPKTVSKLESAFFNNPLTSISIDGGDYYVVEDGIVYSKDRKVVILGVSTTTKLVCGPNVTTIGTNSFRNTKINSVTFNEGLTTIGQGAFWGALLTEIELPSSFVGGGNYEFVSCIYISKVTFKGITKVLSSHMFDGCKSLTEIILPRGVVTIDAYCFMGCSNLKYIWIPNTTISIGGGALKGINANCDIVFENGSSLIMDGELLYTSQFKTLIMCFAITGNSEVTVHWATTTISQTVFQDTTYERVLFPSNGSLTLIRSEAFKNSQITEIEIPSTVTSIESKAFSGCTKLTTLTLPEKLSQIPGECFMSCSTLQSIYIPKGVTKISDSAFEGCSAVKTLEFADECELENIGARAFYGIAATKVVLPRMLQKAGMKSFTMPKLARIEVASGCNISAIMPQMFADCTSLDSFELGSSVKEIQESAFEGCTKLSAVSLPTSVESVESYAFRNCRALQSFRIEYGSQLQRIVGVAFSGCEKLPTISVASENRAFTSEGSALYDFEKRKIILYLPSSSATEFKLPDTIVEIGGNAFEGCEKLEHVEINEGCKTIGIFAFSGCRSLKSISIPQSVTEVLVSAFANIATLECGSVSFFHEQENMLIEAGVPESGLTPCPTVVFTAGSGVAQALSVYSIVFIVAEDNE